MIFALAELPFQECNDSKRKVIRVCRLKEFLAAVNASLLQMHKRGKTYFFVSN